MFSLVNSVGEEVQLPYASDEWLKNYKSLIVVKKEGTVIGTLSFLGTSSSYESLIDSWEAEDDLKALIKDLKKVFN